MGVFYRLQCNRCHARHSTNPSIVRFDVVRGISLMSPLICKGSIRLKFLCLPPPRHLITIPSKVVKMPKKKSAVHERKSAAAEGGLRAHDPHHVLTCEQLPYD